jgi:hypothetical protein
MWCIGTPSARYVAKMEDILDVYQRPYDVKRPVVCVDEAMKELHDTPRPGLPAKVGRPKRVDYEYSRQGQRNLFVTVEPMVGRCSVRMTERHTSVDFAEHLRWLVDEEYPEADMIVLVTDNLNTHTTASLYEAFDPSEAHRIANRLEWHYTPEHGSWLNVAEIEISILTRQCLARRIPDAETLEREVTAWQKEKNIAPSKINWQFTTDDARVKLRRLYPERETS